MTHGNQVVIPDTQQRLGFITIELIIQSLDRRTRALIDASWPTVDPHQLELRRIILNGIIADCKRVDHQERIEAGHKIITKRHITRILQTINGRISICSQRYL